jgi:hypothetical protein
MPMEHFLGWTGYSIAAMKAYDEFLGPVNEAINKLQSERLNWASPLSSSGLDVRTLDVGAGRLPSEPLALPNSSRRSQSGSSLSASRDSDAHTSRNSTKRLRRCISDDPTDLEYGNPDASGSDERRSHGRGPKGRQFEHRSGLLLVDGERFV